MKPIEEEELQNVRVDYLHFLQLNNTPLKSAYLAASGRGFTNLICSDRNAVLLEREKDGVFLCCSYPQKPIEEKTTDKEERIIRFHNDKSIF